MEKQNYDVIKTVLKSATYSIIGTAGTMIIQYLQSGVDYKTAIISGLVIGAFAGVKNLMKFYFDMDLDLAAIKSLVDKKVKKWIYEYNARI